MHLGLIVDKAQELADRKDADWDVRCKQWVNEAIQEWARKLPWPTLRRIEDFTFENREGTGRILTLPQRVDKIDRVADDTNNVVLRAGANPDLDFPNKHLDNANGNAFMWRELGIGAVHKQPAAATTIRAQTTVSDVFTVYVSGMALDTAASGTPDNIYRASEELSISSSGLHTSTTLFVSIDTIGKIKLVSNADVVISSAADGQLARLNLADQLTRYRQIELIGAPTAGTVFQIEYLLLPPKLRNDNDMPPPAIDVSYLIWYTAAMIQRAQGNVQEAELLVAHSAQLLERQATYEKNTGDQDFRSYPEPLYWNNEDSYMWPPRGGG